MSRIRHAALVAVIATLASATVVSAANPGKYSGRSKDGGLLTITVNKSGTGGVFKWCSTTIKFTISNDKFSVDKNNVSATGRFRGNKVSGKIKPSSCSGSPDTYSLKRS